MTGVVIRIMGPMLLMKDSAGTHISFFFRLHLTIDC